MATVSRPPREASGRERSRPRVAVVVPCFNDGPLLDDALGSLDRQESCEVAVVDDGSTDAATAGALRRAEERGVTVLRQPNAGPSRARMRAFGATTAPYVMALDADDLLVPGAVARLADALDADPALDAAWGDVEMFGALEAVRRSAAEVDPWAITYLNDLPAAALFRREALQGIGGWSLDDGYEDWDLWMRFAAAGLRGRNVGGVFHRYRQNPAASRRASDLGEHARLMAVLRDRNRGLYAERRRNWRSSPAPWGVRLGLPFVAILPGLDEAARFRWEHAVARAFDPRWRMIREGVPEPAGARLAAAKLRRGAARAARRIARR